MKAIMNLNKRQKLHIGTKFPANGLQVAGACITACSCGLFTVVDSYANLCRFPYFLWFFGVCLFGAGLVVLGYVRKGHRKEVPDV